jgi:hypothetical protein
VNVVTSRRKDRDAALIGTKVHPARLSSC